MSADPTTPYAPWQQRVIEEKQELDKKLKALQEFIGGKQFASLDDVNRGLLLSQREWMFRYSDVLEQRINLFVTSISKD